jgi:hypothetical protein
MLKNEVDRRVHAARPFQVTYSCQPPRRSSLLVTRLLVSFRRSVEKVSSRVSQQKVKTLSVLLFRHGAIDPHILINLHHLHDYVLAPVPC